MIRTEMTRSSEPVARKACTLWRCLLCDSLVWIDSDVCFSTATCPLCRSIDLHFCGRSDSMSEDSFDNA